MRDTHVRVGHGSLKFFMEKQILSAIDANLNRSLEGLRVCEDVMRFCLKNGGLSSRFKELRHRIAGEAGRFSHSKLLYGRDVEADTLKFEDLETEKSRGSLESLVAANLHRAAEALRSLEEFSKLACPGMKRNPFQEIRFALYSLESEAMSAVLRKSKCDRFGRALYAIIDSGQLEGRDFPNAAKKMIRGGASVIQMRMKNASMKEVLARATELAGICRKGGVLFLVNDYPEIALLAGADGVHLGANELGVREVRRLLPPDMIIGITLYPGEDISRALAPGPDYAAVGPIYDTTYRVGAASSALKGLGIDMIERTRGASGIPLVAIGGINAENAGAAIAAGADSVAVLSYLYQNGRIEKNCRSIVDAIQKASGDE
jgi:thiamine-phosphate pyrophosphorylase